MVMFTFYQKQPLSPAFYKRGCKPQQSNFSPLSCICRSPISKLIWVFSGKFKKFVIRKLPEPGELTLVETSFETPFDFQSYRELEDFGRDPQTLWPCWAGSENSKGPALGQPLPRMIQTFCPFCAWKCQCWWNFSKTNFFFAKPNSPAKLLDNQPVATNVMTYFLRK